MRPPIGRARPWLAPFLALAFALGSFPAAPALAKEKAAADTAKPAAGQVGGLQDPAELKALKYRSIGPAWGGRATRAAGVPGNPKVYFVATAGGGVWRSLDAGASWRPVFDEQPISSIGSLAVAPSDPNVIYAGSGEANIRGNVAAGNGIYKSTDGGKSWSHVWQQEGQIGTMVVHPQDADVAFAAVLGHAFGPNPERGVYRTRDGGKSWQQVLKKDVDTGASDVALDPANPNVVFAGLWQARRQPWGMTSGGPGSGLWVSRDGGDTWKQLSGNGLPDGTWGKVGVAVAPSDGRRVYALIEAEKGGLYRSDDGGGSWTLATASRELRQRAWYYSTVTVSPTNPDEVWCPNVPMLKSIDGGKTFKKMFLSHGDHHDLWIDPKDPKRMIGATDGGIDISTDGGETWLGIGLPIGQFYHVSVDNRVPFRVAGAMQDIGTAQAPSNTLRAGGIYNSDWYGVGGGEAGWVVSDPLEPDVVYAGEYLGYISRYDHRTKEVRNVSAWPDNPSGFAAGQMKYRFQWTAPILISPHPPHALYHAANVLFRSTDRGQSWQAVSPDLTRDDESRQQWSGGPITGDNTGAETYCTIFAVAESPLEKGVLWAGSDDGLVHVSRDDGATWQNVTAAIPGMPEWGTVSMIEPSRHHAGTAYLAVDAHRLDDMRPYLWKTADYGRSWQRLDGGLPRDVYLHAVREDPEVPGMLYLGTERGVAFTRDGGRTWQSLRLNMPSAAVHDLQVKDGSLVLATLGRSLWILDDLAAVRGLSKEVTGKEVAWVAAPDAVRWTLDGGASYAGFAAENPPRGALLYYWLKEEPKEKEEVTIEVLDAQGRLVRTLSSKPAEPTGFSEYVELESLELGKRALPKKAGVQRGVWDFLWNGSEMIQGGILDSGYPGIGPQALPGDYTLRLKVGEKTAETQLEVLPDPRAAAAAAEQDEQLRFSLEVRDAITRLTRAVERLRTVRKQLVARNELLAQEERAAELRKGAEELLAKLDAVEAKLHNPRAQVSYDVLAMQGGAALYSRLSPLLDWVAFGIGAPTQGMRAVFAERQQELAACEAELESLLANDLAALDQTADRLDLPRVWVPAAQ